MSVLLAFIAINTAPAAVGTYTSEFSPYGTVSVQITGHTPATLCKVKPEVSGGFTMYILLPHCAQRIWEPADLLKYKIISTFNPSPGYIVIPQTVNTEYILPKMTDADKVADPKSQQVASFSVKLDENAAGYKEREGKGYDSATKRRKWSWFISSQ